MVLELPAEIWIAIIVHLSPSDLTRLSRVSSTLLPIAQATLYRRVTLPGRENTLSTLSLLTSGSWLSRTVQELSVKPPLYHARPELTESLLEALPHLVNLQKFSVLDSAIFPIGQQRFLEIMRHKDPPLTEFRYQESFGRVMGQVFDLKEFANIKRLAWDVRIETTRAQQPFVFRHDTREVLGQVLHASRETLENITVTCTLKDFPGWSYRFPKLQRLAFRRVWFYDVLTVLVVPDVADFIPFLLNHPTIEELYFGREIGPKQPWVETSHQWTGQDFPMLPRLQKFTGPVLLINHLMESWDTFGKQLKYLKITQLEESSRQLESLFQNLTSRPYRLELTTVDLGVAIFQSMKAGDNPNLFHNAITFTTLCASTVENYRGPIPKNYEDLLPFLSSFMKLKELWVCRHHVCSTEGLLEASKVLGIAGICGNLARLHIVSDDVEEEISCVKRFMRDAVGDVLHVI